MELTPQDQELISKAISLLEPYNKEEESSWAYYFEVQDEEGDTIDGSDFMEYDCCESEECMEKTLAELRAINPSDNIQAVYWPNNGDHERIDCCYQCGKPLNEQLTWIDQELQHHESENITKADLTTSHIAFEVLSMFKALPSVDRQDVAERAIKYAKVVIAELT